MSDTIQTAARAIANARALVISAGAGMGVDSGMPDFRGSEGFWRAYPAYAKLGMRFEGRHRDHMYAHGKWRDSLVYSILEDEWHGDG